ncbi:DUF4214 domain-containing protein [Alsobacter soli]|uniref:DUF4214 domain-containing protein n=1 Tax=Alsobacter soli TaxID=2109933 RepID=UPI0011B23B2D|nr:DUF4214 domain-containing protein [Alsobacter soli]
MAASFMVVMAVTSPSRGEAAVKDVMFGVNGHPFTAYPGVSLETQLTLAAGAGLRSYRVNVSGVHMADRLGSLIRLAKQHGVEILPVLTPALDIKKSTPEQLRKDAYDLAFTLVSRFKDDVRVWELGNELENYAIITACEQRDDGVQYNCNWGPAGGDSPLDYYGPRWAKVSAVLGGLSEGTVAADPTVRKAIGTAGWGHIGAFERMQQDGIKWDISVWHMYKEDPSWGLSAVSKFGRPIWITEFNQDFGSKGGDQVQADGLRRWINRIRELAPLYKIEAAHIYELMDETYWWPNFEAAMGLVRLEGDGSGGWRTGAPKPAYYAVRELLTGESVPAPAAEAAMQPLPSRKCQMGALPGDAPIPRRISYAYCLALGRDADGGGLQDWSKTIAGNPDGIPSVLVSLLLSDEFKQRAPGAFRSHEAFVATLYRVLLDRDPDPVLAGPLLQGLQLGKLTYAAAARNVIASPAFRQAHPALVSGASATEVAASAAKNWRVCRLNEMQSPNTAKQVDYAYCLVLGRNADGAGLRDYSERVKGGDAPYQIAISLAGSDEFVRKLGGSAVDPATTVRLLHLLLLGREPSSEELNRYSGRLGSGAMSAQDLAGEIIRSAEFKQRRPVLFAGY